ncbi:MAG: hypothetical protein U0T69_06890 [Chitinophagales bacterium]
MTKKTVYDISFVLFLTSICHLLFSKYGFNPTDEGFVLSATNRVLHGQIPHVDFSSVRPLGYAYLHIPELLISKTHFYLVSRFVFWLEQVLIAFLWIQFLLKYSKQEISLFNKYILIVLCFTFNVHYFPCSVLHTIDGLLMCMIGLNLIILEKKWNFVGFFFLGFAVLCKQNYLVVLPFSLFLFSRKNIIINLITGFSPVLIYVGFICFHNGLQDLIVQLSGHNELIKVGVLCYVLNPFVYIGIIGIFIYSKLKINKLYFVLLMLIFALGILCTNHYHGKFGFVFFGILIAELSIRLKKNEEIISSIVALLIAWSVSISVGYNTPALFIGGIISFFFLHNTKENKTNNRIIYLFTFITIISFYFVRTHIVYRDSPAKNLTYKLDGIVEGATGIYTNKNTFAVLKELDSLKNPIPNLVIIPDFTACNILHSHESKILTEWPNKTEIPNDKILTKVTSKIKNDSTLIFAIPVFQTALLKDGFTPQKNSGLNYPIIKFVKDNYKKVQYSNYFELRSK